MELFFCFFQSTWSSGNNTHLSDILSLCAACLYYACQIRGLRIGFGTFPFVIVDNCCTSVLNATSPGDLTLNGTILNILFTPWSFFSYSNWDVGSTGQSDGEDRHLTVASASRPEPTCYYKTPGSHLASSPARSSLGAEKPLSIRYLSIWQALWLQGCSALRHAACPWIGCDSFC